MEEKGGAGYHIEVLYETLKFSDEVFKECYIEGIKFFLSGYLRRFLKIFFGDATFLTEKIQIFHSLKQFEGKKHENKCFFIIFIVKFY